MINDVKDFPMYEKAVSFNKVYGYKYIRAATRLLATSPY